MANPARRLRIRTDSGSTYLFDRDEMTWTRYNTSAGREDIPGMAGIKGGTLDSFPDPVEVGRPLRFYIPPRMWITTTIVRSVEDVT